VEPVVAAPLPGANDGDGKKMVTVEMAAAKAPEQAARRRRVRLNPAAGTNAAGSEGTA